MVTVGRAALCTALSLWLVACSNDSPPPAPISSVGGGSAGAENTPTPTGSARINSANNGNVVPSPPGNTHMLPQPPSKESMQSGMGSSSGISSNSGMTNSSGLDTSSNNGSYKRSYSNIPKGSYTGNTYTVKRGDTLFYIAWITGNDFRDLSARNNIPAPYGLNVGQVLQVSGGNLNSSATTTNTGNGGMLNPSSSPQPTATSVNTAGAVNVNNQNVEKMLPKSGEVVTTTSTPATTTETENPVTSASGNNAPISVWKWPTEGKTIDSFSTNEGGNKGIDIAGSKGQAILATASGRVVYAGNALRGYGNLIIIKHNDDYLSAYAHNDSMLVREQQDVTAGQKIATMGSTGTSSVRLHFEIRYKGKSVNPLRYLPQR